MNTTGILQKIVSGGQTGVDRAALDWAIAAGIPHGGWCPAGRVAEDGVISAHYDLQELPESGYRQRTRQNVIDSDGTLIVTLGELNGGTLQTRIFAEQYAKPYLVIDAVANQRALQAGQVLRWLQAHRIRTLNVAGPRESKSPGSYNAAYTLLCALSG